MSYDEYKVDVPEGESGNWKVERFTVDAEKDGFQLFRMGGRAPTSGDYTRLMCGGSVVMSDTCAEIGDHLPILFRLKECEPGTRVLIHGLGLGMVLNAALDNPNVEHVDVVEFSSDVIALVGDHYMAKADGRLTIHEGDAYTYKFPKGTHWHLAWHDIWTDICTDDLEGHAKLNRRYARNTDWQGCWVHDLLISYRRREKREESMWGY